MSVQGTQPTPFVPSHDPGVRLSKAVTIPNAPLPAEGNGTFSNYVLAGIVALSPFAISRILIPLLTLGFWRPGLGFWSYLFLLPIAGLPATVASVLATVSRTSRAC
jgi:hypothetical protein